MERQKKGVETFNFYLYPKHEMDVIVQPGGGTIKPQRVYVNVEGELEWSGDPDHPPYKVAATDRMRLVTLHTNTPQGESRFNTPFKSWNGTTGYGWNLAVDDVEEDNDFGDYLVDINLKYVG